jgi:hypothetical protein
MGLYRGSANIEVIMDYKVLDREFRDYTAELKYPFSDNAVLGALSGLSVPAEAFLDIVLYVPEDIELPVYVSSMRKTDDREKAILEFRDSFDNYVAEVIIDLGTDSAMVYRQGIDAGAVVYNSAYMRQLVYGSHRADLFFGNNLPVMTGRCFSYKPPHMIGIKDSAVGDTETGTVHRDTIYLVGANGIHFEDDTEDAGAVTINMLGEESPATNPLVSINGIAVEHFWIAAHPESEVKVETIKNGIKIRSIIDD